MLRLRRLPVEPAGVVAVTDPNDDDVVAVLYEIGGRRESPNTSRLLYREEFEQLTGDHDGPVSQETARARYRARIARRGGAA